MTTDHIWHPYTRFSALRQGVPVIVGGEGAWLIAEDGRRYLDAISSWWCCNLGHGHKRVVDAIRQQAGLLQHSILGNMSHRPALRLAQRVAELFPTPERHVLFASDGSCAVDAALKIAVQYWRNQGRSSRTEFVSLESAYHGDTIGAMSVGYVPTFHECFQPLLFAAQRVEAPCCSLCPHGERPESCELTCLHGLRRVLAERADSVAGVIVEPLCLAAGGMKIYSARCLRELAACCREAGVLLIVDEIAMGFGRTGRMFAFEHAGIDPDIVCIGKGLSSGYLPISATVVSDAIYGTFSDGDGDDGVDRTLYHGHTFGGNPIAAAAALATLDAYRDEAIVKRAETLGRQMADSLAVLQGETGVRDVRSLGMIGVVELEGDRGVERARRVRAELADEGILVRPLGNVLYMMPPLVTSREDLEFLLTSFLAAIRRAAR
ncbi:MAG: adenosylmethionine--8-amino-7-oxononanoate transaminase [Pirellulaceae bacterium]